MLLNTYRTLTQGRKYLAGKQYPKTLLATYLTVSITLGIALAAVTTPTALPIVTVTVLLFLGSLNALGLLASTTNSSDPDTDPNYDQRVTYYRETLYVTIHSIGIGLPITGIAAVHQLFPGLTVTVWTVDVAAAVVFTAITYYVIVLSVVVTRVAEFIHMQAHSTA